MGLAAGDQQKLIEVRNVSFRYDSVPVLEDVSFPVQAGDFLAIIGPNGSGKTTLRYRGCYRPTGDDDPAVAAIRNVLHGCDGFRG